MKKEIKNIFMFIWEKRRYLSLFILTSNIIIAFLELIGLTAIPIYLAFLINSEEYISKYKIFDEINFFEMFDQNSLLFFGSLMILIFFIFKNLYSSFITYFQEKMFLEIKSDSASNLLHKYLNKNYNFFLNNNSSKLIRNITTETHIASGYVSSLFQMFKDLSVGAFLLFGMVYADPKVMMGLLVTVIIILFFYNLTTREMIKTLTLSSRNLRNDKLKILSEIFNIIKIIKLGSSEDFFKKHFKSKNYTLEKNNFILILFSKLPRNIIEIISIGALLFLLYFLLHIKNLSLEATLPLITFFTLCFLRIYPLVNSIASTLPGLKSGRLIFNIINNELNLIEKKDTNSINKNFANFKFENFALKNINFNYENKNELFKNLNLEIEKNDYIAIIGRSGAGKSTLIDIVMGFQKPSSGKVILNNKEIKKDFTNLQNSIGYIPQNIYLIDESIEKNIALGVDEEKIDKERIREVLKLSQLTDFVKNLPNKEKSLVGEKGARISGGQIQRIGIARALYSDPEILIFDEATASLDKITEELLLNEIELLSKNFTVISITHKQEIAERCKKIFRIEDNQLIKIR